MMRLSADLAKTPAFPAEVSSQDETDARDCGVEKQPPTIKPEPQAGNTRRTLIEQAGEV